jgi:glutamyl-tRNA synthetase
MGYLPEALLNYLVRLGWSHGDQEVFSLAEMIELFSIDDVNRKAAAFDHDKLNWLNQYWMKTLPAEQVAPHLEPQFHMLEIDPSQGPALADLVGVQAERVETLAEMAAQSRPFYEEFADYDAGAAKKHLRPVAEEPLRAVRAALEAVDDWTPEALDRAVRATADSLELGMGKIAQPLRVALMGTGMSPSIDLTLWLVGKERTLARIDRALEFIAARAAARG